MTPMSPIDSPMGETIIHSQSDHNHHMDYHRQLHHQHPHPHPQEQDLTHHQQRYNMQQLKRLSSSSSNAQKPYMPGI